MNGFKKKSLDYKPKMCIFRDLSQAMLKSQNSHPSVFPPSECIQIQIT